jgi:hypothetical protein
VSQDIPNYGDTLPLEVIGERRVPVIRRPRPSWLPPEGTYAARPAGKDWDAVQIDGACAWAVLAYLERLAPGGIGPVLCDPGGPAMRLTFLVPPDTAAAWNEPRTAALGPACWLTIPGDEEHDRLDGLHWLTPPRYSRKTHMQRGSVTADDEHHVDHTLRRMRQVLCSYATPQP